VPELPEAEANRARIAEGALNRTIAAVELGTDTTHVELPGRAARERLVGRRFSEARRHGKLVFAGSDAGPWIAVHLGMTGFLSVHEVEEEAPAYARILFAFEGGRRLAYRCKRKLGWVRVVEDPGAFVAREGYGPDALEIGREDFAARLGGGRGGAKSALMNQKTLAGLGNLWSDEVLFRAGVSPKARTGELIRSRLDALYDEMREGLETALSVGSDYAALPGEWLLHRREAGAECPRCGGEIAKETVAGRSAYFCLRHQT